MSAAAGPDVLSRFRLYRVQPDPVPYVPLALCPRREVLTASGQAALDTPFVPYLTVLRWIPPDYRPPRRISDAARFRGRRRRLRQRLERKRPLFADDEYDAEVAARPGYYGVESPA